MYRDLLSGEVLEAFAKLVLVIVFGIALLAGCGSPCEIVKSENGCIDATGVGPDGGYCRCQYWLECDGEEYWFFIGHHPVDVPIEYVCKRLSTEIPGYEGTWIKDKPEKVGAVTCADDPMDIAAWMSEQDWCPWDAPL